MEKAERIDVEAIKARVTVRQVVEAFVPGIRWRREGRELVACSPFKAERTPSFKVDERRGVFYCFSTGAGGDAIRFVQVLEGLDFPRAARRIAERLLGAVPSLPDDDDERQRRADERARRMAEIEADEAAARALRRKSAVEIWGECEPARNTIVETYLAARAIDLGALERVYGWRVPASIRFHPSLRAHEGKAAYCGPAMVGAAVDLDGNVVGIHRTYLAADGYGKAPIPHAKMTLGSIMGSLGILADGGPTGFARDDAIVGEGYETTLTMLAALARRGRAIFAVSAFNLGNMTGAGLDEKREPHPSRKGHKLPSAVPDPSRPGLMLPPFVKRVTLLMDADGKDPAAMAPQMKRAAAKFGAAGIKARIAAPEAGHDFNDMIKGVAA